MSIRIGEIINYMMRGANVKHTMTRIETSQGQIFVMDALSRGHYTTLFVCLFVYSTFSQNKSILNAEM